MGFLSKITGIDKTVKGMTSTLYMHIMSLGKLKTIQEIKDYLEMMNIQYGILEDGSLKWVLHFDTKDAVILMYHDDNKSISGYFDSSRNSPLSELSVGYLGSHKLYTYSIGGYQGQEDYLPEVTKIFINNLEELGFQKI